MGTMDKSIFLLCLHPGFYIYCDVTWFTWFSAVPQASLVHSCQSFMLYYYSCYRLFWRSMTAVRQMLARSAKPFVAPSVIIAQFPSQESRIWKGGRGILSVLVDWLITNGTITLIRFQWMTDFFSQDKLVQTLSYLLYFLVHSPWRV